MSALSEKSGADLPTFPVAPDPFDSADRYSLSYDVETLEHDGPAEALAEHGALEDPNDDFGYKTIVVFAWKRKVIDMRAAGCLKGRIEGLIDDWAGDEELVHDEGLVISPETRVAIDALVESIRTTAKPWCHDLVGKREFSIAEARAIVGAR